MGKELWPDNEDSNDYNRPVVQLCPDPPVTTLSPPSISRMCSSTPARSDPFVAHFLFSEHPTHRADMRVYCYCGGPVFFIHRDTDNTTGPSVCRMHCDR